MNQTAYLTPQEYRFQISNQSYKPFDPEIGERRDIETRKTIDMIIYRKQK